MWTGLPLHEPAPEMKATCPDLENALVTHNALRARRGAPALRWSVALERSAQDWAGRYADETYHHSVLARMGKVGENVIVFWGAGPDERACGAAAHSFYKDREHPGAWRYAQMMHRDVTHVGCAAVHDARVYRNVVVCQYMPPIATLPAPLEAFESGTLDGENDDSSSVKDAGDDAGPQEHPIAYRKVTGTVEDQRKSTVLPTCFDTYTWCPMYHHSCDPQRYFAYPINRPVRDVCPLTCNNCPVLCDGDACTIEFIAPPQAPHFATVEQNANESTR